MKQALMAENKAQSNNINRAANILYLVLILFQLITGDYDWAIANTGIALDFDPASFIEESFMFTFLAFAPVSLSVPPLSWFRCSNGLLNHTCWQDEVSSNRNYKYLRKSKSYFINLCSLLQFLFNPFLR
jgi:hypothetical protein